MYYIIFADLQAYPKGEFSHIETYKEFIESHCEHILLVADSCYVTIFCKNKETIEHITKNNKFYRTFSHYERYRNICGH